MKKKIIISLTVITLAIIILSTTVLADEITGSMSGLTAGNGNGAITSAGSKIIGIIQAIGISVAVVMTVVMAIRFMLASVEEKAQIKEQLVPFVIGAILIFAVTMIPFFVSLFGQAINKEAKLELKSLSGQMWV